MSQNKIIIITKNANDFISLKKNLSENGMETCTVSSIEKLFVKYISLPFVLAIIDASSYKDEILELVRHLRGAKRTPIPG